MELATSTIWLFDILGGEELKRLLHTDESGSTKRERGLYCASCQFPITSFRHRIEVQGSYEHTFINPDGIVFHLGCFCSAEGCIDSGKNTGEWSWFAGYSWRYALCASCGTHLGWRYSADGAGSFYGLILKRLVVARQA